MARKRRTQLGSTQIINGCLGSWIRWYDPALGWICLDKGDHPTYEILISMDMLADGSRWVVGTSGTILKYGGEILTYLPIVQKK